MTDGEMCSGLWLIANSSMSLSNISSTCFCTILLTVRYFRIRLLDIFLHNIVRSCLAYVQKLDYQCENLGQLWFNCATIGGTTENFHTFVLHNYNSSCIKSPQEIFKILNYMAVLRNMKVALLDTFWGVSITYLPYHGALVY